MPNNVIRRPIHPINGNATIPMALQLTRLYGYGKTSGVPWNSEFSARTEIQGEPLEIPYKTVDEKYGAPGVNATGGKPRETQQEQNDQADQFQSDTEGSDISLFNSPDRVNNETLMKLTMTTYNQVRADPSLVGQNAYTSDVGDTLAKFVATRDKPTVQGGGVMAAFAELLTPVAAAFGQDIKAILADIHAQAISAHEEEYRLRQLPGVVG